MSISRRQILSFSGAVAISPLLTARAPAAAPYPARPVRILVGFPAGGTADILARMTSQWLQERLGQPFIVENRPGAGTNLATEAVVRAPADGYTLLATTTSNLLNGTLYENMTFDFIRDITPVAGLTVQPLVLNVIPAFPARSVPEFIAYAKAHPGAISVGNFGVGTMSHLAAELFKQSTGIDFVDVSYRGSASMLTDLLGGRIQASFDNVPVTVEHLKSGALHALAVTAASRSRALPSVPTMGDFLPNYEAMTVAGIGAPRGTHPDIVEKLNAEINTGLATSTLVDRLDELGSTILGGSPAEFADLIKRETERWAKVIQTAGIKVK
ncbi:tripartite-type tricarboxylate transporter receptor subunit TctC [Bradyrhizobium yuanmingense]|uniref:Bug family tripartite tricarboxylate transporter substrate binding protein n=1 Tax=Bradyrhizobium yuanmingense TaxID=108015 RepID=UPI0005673117|nr:tripartite tricarboxylate transporter substrate binding protein [Bradyrhizobium yuanmingense]